MSPWDALVTFVEIWVGLCLLICAVAAIRDAIRRRRERRPFDWAVRTLEQIRRLPECERERVK